MNTTSAWRVRLGAALVVLAALVVPAHAGTTPSSTTTTAHGTVVQGTYPAVGVPGARTYRLYVPTSARPGAPLVVWLHGCNQNADDAEKGARLDEVADAEGFLVLYPEQRRAVADSPAEDGNGSGCWNWFLPGHQQRGAGEPETLAEMTRDLVVAHDADPRRTFVAGVSAGADMATILGATYPDVYAAIAPIAGCAYRTCADADGTAALAAMGSHARVVPAFVVQGTVDMVNNAAMGATAVQQWLATDDLADDGAANGSVPQRPTRTTTSGADAGTLGTPATGDPCIGGPAHLPCAGGALGLTRYPVTQLDYADAAGRVVVRAWLVHGQNHAIGGGDPRGSFVDPVGPGVAAAAWEFFREHPQRP